MNRQDQWRDGKLIKRGIEWTQPYGRPGYTSNPIFGCKHNCQWQMPDGKWAVCYADLIAQRLMKDRPFEELTFHPDEFTEWDKLKEPSAIFVGSMSDVFGAQVPEEWITEVLSQIRRNPQHIFMLLTKNAQKLRKFEPFPLNAWVGASVPPTRMFKNHLSKISQVNMFATTLKILTTLDARITWLSAEPLAWDLAPMLRTVDISKSPLKWCVIGAASMGVKVYQPNPVWVSDLISALDDKGVRIFFKGNLIGNSAAEPWREEFPDKDLLVSQESLL